MGTKSTRNHAWKCVFFAAAAVVVASFSPAACGQSALATSSAGIVALPVALHALNEPVRSSAIRIADADRNNKPFRPVSVHDHSRRNWLLLVAADSAAATFDAYTTRRAIQSGAVEMNPMLKPFANSNGLYAAIQVSPVLMDVVAYKMQRSENRFTRRMWWLPQSLGTGVSLSAATHNLGNIR
jgi:hypothetical protein